VSKPYIYNEYINKTRLAIIDAVKDIGSFAVFLNQEDIVRLMRIVLKYDPNPDPTRDWHNPELYDKVRSKF
jgi:hypothetical protein